MKLKSLVSILFVLILGLGLGLSGCGDKSDQQDLTKIQLSEVTHSIFYAITSKTPPSVSPCNLCWSISLSILFST
jgi:uncharacterized lipoprotein YehR (DUF1307 family)